MPVADATDIIICLPKSGQSVPVVHITEGNLQLDAVTQTVVTETSGVWERSVVTKLRWVISGMSLHSYSPDYSFATLFAIWKARDDVAVEFKLKASGGEIYSGDIKIASLRTGGNTGQNAMLSFMLIGQGEIIEETPDADTDSDADIDSDIDF